MCLTKNSNHFPNVKFLPISYPAIYTERFIMFSVITNIYNKKTKGPTVMELFTATGKLKFFFWSPPQQLEVFDVCTMGDMAHTDTIFKFLPHVCVART